MKREYSSPPFVRGHSFPPEGSGQVFTLGEGIVIDEKVIEKLEEYYYTETTVKDEVDNGGTCVFAFEGLGSYEGGGNAYHPDGMYGALMLVTKGDKITYITKNSSTLPDWAKKDKATLKKGYILIILENTNLHTLA